MKIGIVLAIGFVIGAIAVVVFAGKHIVEFFKELF